MCAMTQRQLTKDCVSADTYLLSASCFLFIVFLLSLNALFKGIFFLDLKHGISLGQVLCLDSSSDFHPPGALPIVLLTLSVSPPRTRAFKASLSEPVTPTQSSDTNRLSYCPCTHVYLYIPGYHLGDSDKYVNHNSDEYAEGFHCCCAGHHSPAHLHRDTH